MKKTYTIRKRFKTAEACVKFIASETADKRELDGSIGKLVSATVYRGLKDFDASMTWEN